MSSIDVEDYTRGGVTVRVFETKIARVSCAAASVQRLLAGSGFCEWSPDFEEPDPRAS